MKIQQLVQPDRIVLDLEASDAEDAMNRAADLVSPALGVSKEKLVRALLEREKLGSTAVGEGLAIPHCKIQGISEIYVSIIRIHAGVEFAAPDKQPVKVMFVVLSPPDQPAAHLQTLSQIARILKRKEFRRAVLTAGEVSEIVKAVHEAAEAEGL